MEKEFEIFKNGSTWVRADFHLHTKADKEFVYQGQDSPFVSDYVKQLKRQNIGIATITNHNDFDFNEYKALERKARKQEIYLLPGVELSVNDGGNGIHCLVIFNPIEWLKNGTDYINQFINKTFAGKHNYKNENVRSNDNLIETIKILNNFKMDYFIIMAHIEQNSGFFESLKGGRIIDLGKDSIFREAVLGFQKVRTWDNIKLLNEWLGELPAFVEGSDAKKIEEIGTGNLVKGVTQKTYLKIGAFNFEAIKHALLDKQFRLKEETPKPSNGYIKSISFKGGKLDGTTLNLNHSMNNLIGIRGSGKSSILEAIRYSLDINLRSKQNVDSKYKTELVNALLGSGGKITSVLVDNQGNEYYVKKILGDRTEIRKDGELQQGLKPDAILKKPIYFGQKDLSQIGDSLSTEYFINKLIGDRLDIKQEIDKKKQDVLKLITELKKIDTIVARKEDIEAKHAGLKIKIQVFKNKEIDKKLEKQISFDKDNNFIKRLEKFEQKVIDGLNEYVNEYEESFQSFKSYSSKENEIDINAIKKHFEAFESIFREVKSSSSRLLAENSRLKEKQQDFNIKYENLKIEFSKIKRELNLPSIQADDYLSCIKEFDITKAQLSELNRISNERKEKETQLNKTLSSLRNLWYEEFKIVEEEVHKVNDDQDSFEITVDFNGNREDFKSYLKDNFRGCNLRDHNIDAIINNYNDMIAIYEDLNLSSTNISGILSDVQLNRFREYFNRKIETFLTYRVPDKFDIIYQKRSLNEHSLGQRASALIIFLLTLKESDLIIIDQPEDDLDNQTIYNDVIKVLKTLKNSSQFIFATHNPNIPVLGDCEQVISCKYDSTHIQTILGSVDKKIIKNEIVNIMEGGREAFNKRKKIYESWTH